MQTAVEKAKQIKLLILDVDGILTTGIVYYVGQHEQMRGFHLHDGLGIKLMQKCDINIAIISGKRSEAVEKRVAELGIEHAYLGNDNKLPAYDELKTNLNLQDHEIAYMGDDLPDLPLLRRAGLAVTVPNAPVIIQQHVDIVTTKKGGKGAVREICEFILNAQEKYQPLLQSYLT
ncbi:MAG: hypothetical protein ACD_46C00306G0003 [uncultured bacterium]|nr:MAG: hypothetical protein ACD_46C00306G0003 [uncultured bacterium]